MIGCRNLFQYALVREDQTVMISLSSGALFLQFVNMVAGPLRWVWLHGDDRPEFFPYTAARMHHRTLAGSIALHLFERWKLWVCSCQFVE